MAHVIALMILSLDSLSCGVCVYIYIYEYSVFAWYAFHIRF